MRCMVLLSLILAAGCRDRREPVAEPAAASAPAKVQAKAGWNDGEIEWKSWSEAKASAEKTGRPICLVFFTTWCPHCTNYAKVFHDDRVVEAAKKFVMVRVDKEAEEELSAEYAPDGEYIPRTYFLDSKAQLRKEIRAQDGEYAYFFDESNPASLLAAMKKAL